MSPGLHSAYSLISLRYPAGLSNCQSLALLSAAFLSTAVLAQPAVSPDDLTSMSLEELANLQITSVSKRQQSISTAPASIYVITNEDIRRSGATSLPEILRLAPNLQVAGIDNVQYAISARGFNNTIGNKLLVLIDGRTVYTPLFSGVFWEMQDTFLQDIDRIEVISGPGATLWGANAVNGVINVITRPAKDTTGTLVSGEAGDRENGIAARTGGNVGEQWHWRAYAKAREWDHTNLENGAPVRDAWKRQQLGFRTDWDGEGREFTLQGDAYTGKSEDRGTIGTLVIPAEEISGANLQASWTRKLSDSSDLHVQAYWSHTRRDEFVLFSPTDDILDLEFQHNFSVASHKLLWGGGYRYGDDQVDPGIFTAVLPAIGKLHWENIFINDEFPLSDKLNASLGVKLEWNDYTGMEYLPSARLAWTLAENQLLWTAFSRAVRAPSRFDTDVYFPQTPPYIVAGGPAFVSEVAKVIELGYRAQLSASFNFSATLYHHDWNHLRSGTPLPLPTHLANNIEGEVYGLEAWASWQVMPGWRLGGGVTTLGEELAFEPGTSDTAGTNNATLRNDPDYQWTLRSSHDFGNKLQLDLDLRQIDELTVQPVPRYLELNARLAWLPLPGLELALTGRNLLHDDHAEFGPLTSRSVMDRSILLGIRWSH